MQFTITITEEDLQGDPYNPKDCPGYRAFYRGYNDYLKLLSEEEKHIVEEKPIKTWCIGTGYNGCNIWGSFEENDHFKNMITSEIGDVVTFKKLK